MKTKGKVRQMAMYVNDKNQRVTLRLNNRQFQFVKERADSLDVSPSEFLRMVINAAMTSEEKIQKALEEKRQEGQGAGRENDETGSDDIV